MWSGTARQNSISTQQHFFLVKVENIYKYMTTALFIRGHQQQQQKINSTAAAAGLRERDRGNHEPDEIKHGVTKRKNMKGKKRSNKRHPRNEQRRKQVPNGLKIRLA